MLEGRQHGKAAMGNVLWALGCMEEGPGSLSVTQPLTAALQPGFNPLTDTAKAALPSCLAFSHDKPVPWYVRVWKNIFFFILPFQNQMLVLFGNELYGSQHSKLFCSHLFFDNGGHGKEHAAGQFCQYYN